MKPWIGRKVADATRALPVGAAAAVDGRVAPFAHALSWGRIDAIIAAAVIDADPQAAAAEAAAAGTDLGVWVSASSDHGFKDIYIRAEAPDAIRFDGTVERVADGLSRLGDTRGKDARRAAAVGYLADPYRSLALFDDVAAAAGVALETPNRPTAPLVDTRPPVTLYVHLAQQALESGTGAARVEGIGAVLVDRVRTWLGHAQVTVKPVIDLAGQVPVDAYEIPDRLRDAVHLRSPVDCFPFATSTRRSGDIDHTVAYISPDTGGPPGQTATANLGPLTRFHHRIKTHSRWGVAQPFDGIFVWRSPHGRHYLVDHTGTHCARSAA